MAREMHKLQFDLAYEDGIICDQLRPIRSVELTGFYPKELVWQMWDLYDRLDTDIDQLEFYLDDVCYEASSTLFHYCFAKDRITYDEMMKAMRMTSTDDDEEQAA